ncbi:MAG: hypothetical protein ACMZ63_06510 [Methylotenera sp.]
MNELFSTEQASYSLRKRRALGNAIICLLFPVIVLATLGFQSLPNISEYAFVRFAYVVFWLFVELSLVYAVFKIESGAIYFQNLFQLNLILANLWYFLSALNIYAQTIN